jgi:hypothetical protein
VAVAEQAGQQHLLRGPGVLVLVEQHHPAGGPLDLPDLGAVPGEGGGQRHHVAEVEQLALALERGVPVDEGQQLLAGPLAGQHLPRRGLQLSRRLRGAAQPLADLAHGRGVHEVL